MAKVTPIERARKTASRHVVKLAAINEKFASAQPGFPKFEKLYNQLRGECDALDSSLREIEEIKGGW